MLKFILKQAIHLEKKDEITKARMKMRMLNVEGIAVFESDKRFHLSNTTREWNARLETQDSRLDSEGTGALNWFSDRGTVASAGAGARETAASEPSRYRSRSRSRKPARLEPAREPVRFPQAPTPSTEPASASSRLPPAPTAVTSKPAPGSPHVNAGAQNPKAVVSENEEGTRYAIFGCRRHTESLYYTRDETEARRQCRVKHVHEYQGVNATVDLDSYESMDDASSEPDLQARSKVLPQEVQSLSQQQASSIPKAESAMSDDQLQTRPTLMTTAAKRVRWMHLAGGSISVRVHPHKAGLEYEGVDVAVALQSGYVADFPYKTAQKTALQEAKDAGTLKDYILISLSHEVPTYIDVTCLEDFRVFARVVTFAKEELQKHNRLMICGMKRDVTTLSCVVYVVLRHCKVAPDECLAMMKAMSPEMHDAFGLRRSKGCVVMQRNAENLIARLLNQLVSRPHLRGDARV